MRILLFSENTLFKYNVSTILSPIVGMLVVNLHQLYHAMAITVSVYNETKIQFTGKKNLSIPTRNLYQVMDLGVLARDLYCESCGITSRQIAGS